MLNRSLVRRLLPAMLAIAATAVLASSASAAPIKIESGASGSCYLESGAAYCWTGGSLYSGPYGLSGNPSASEPTLRAGLTAGVTDISLGESTSCAVVSGAAKCWGTSFQGQVGSSDHFGAFAPVPVDGLSSGVSDVSAAAGYSCAVVSGAVKCWGASETDGYGLGIDLLVVGGNYYYSTPSNTIPTLTSGATAVDGGDKMACAIVSGAVKCWGEGYLGDGTNHTDPGIATVTGMTDSVTAIEVDGGMACAVRLGELSCWGEGTSMIDAAGNHTTSATPIIPPGLDSGITAVSVGPNASCAIASGAVKCWGDGKFGQLGNGVVSPFSPPTTVTGAASGATAIATNRFVGCAIVGTDVKCWGPNERGLLGDGTLTDAFTPIAVPSLASGVTDISAGVESSCAVVSGVGKCWGNVELLTAYDPGYKLIGSETPTTVAGLESGVTDIDTSLSGCAIVTGSTKCWQRSTNSGTLPTFYSLPGATSDASDVDLTWSQGCVVVEEAAKCGSVSSPYGYADDYSVETVDALSTGVTQVAEAGNHRCAIQYGAAKCWGFNSYGELGTGASVGGGPGPQQVVGLTSGVTSISAGTSSGIFPAGFTCAVVNAAAKCWGQGLSGELGDGELTHSRTPVQVEGLTSGVTSVSAGDGHACAVKDGDVYCWGSLHDGGLGNNQAVGSSTPVKALDLPSTVTQVSAGHSHNCAIAGGAAYCWGTNTRGQLGVGSTIGLKTATVVAAPGDHPSVGFVRPGDQMVHGNSVQVEVVSANAVSVQCSLDDGLLTACPSSYSNLSEGSHQLRAHAENAAGQIAIAYASVTIDTVAPKATIISPADGSVVTTNTPALYFELDDPYDSYPTCTLDGVELYGADFHACDELEKLPPLSAGAHTLVVTATDYYGNSSSTTSTFTYKPASGPAPPDKAIIKSKAGLTGKAKKSGKSLKVGYVFSFTPPSGAAPALACSGKVKVTAKYGKKRQTVSAKLAASGKSCRAKANFKLPRSTGGKKVTFDAFFAGNSVVAADRDVTKLKIKR